MVDSYKDKIDKIARRLLAANVAVTGSVRDKEIQAEFNGLIPPKAINDVAQRISEIEDEGEEDRQSL